MATLQAGKLGAFGFYPQVSVGAEPASEYYWMRGTVAEFAPQQQVQDLGMLIGGSLLPEGQVKTGIFSGGRFVTPPFLDDYFGWLLYAFAGTMTTAAGTLSGTYKHYFPANDSADDAYPDKVLAIHKITPTDETYDMGEQFLDCLVSRMQFGFTGGDFVTWSGEFLGKRPTVEDATGTGWTVGDLKCKESVPITALPLTSALQFPIGTNISVGQAVTLDLRNITPGYRDVAVLGSYDPHSWPVLNRSIGITVRLLFHDADLYKLAFYDAGGAWNPEIFTSSFQVTAQSPALIDSEVDDEDGALSYTTEGADKSFTDAGQDWAAWENGGGDAEYWIEVYAAGGALQSRAFLGAGVGAGPTHTEIKVYKDVGCTITGWLVDGSSGTPGTYKVFPVQRYELGFTAPSVTWTATPPTLAGNDLVRVDFQGMVTAQCGTDGSVPDWNLWLINKTATYTWPT